MFSLGVPLLRGGVGFLIVYKVSFEKHSIVHGSGIEDRHLVAGLENARADLKEKAHKISMGNDQIGFPLKYFFSRHPNAPLRPKIPHRNSLKKCSLSEKVMKEGERVPFHCGHFATSTDLKELIMQFWQLVTSNFK